MGWVHMVGGNAHAFPGIGGRQGHTAVGADLGGGGAAGLQHRDEPVQESPDPLQGADGVKKLNHDGIGFDAQVLDDKFTLQVLRPQSLVHTLESLGIGEFGAEGYIFAAHAVGKGGAEPTQAAVSDAALHGHAIFGGKLFKAGTDHNWIAPFKL